MKELGCGTNVENNDTHIGGVYPKEFPRGSVQLREDDIRTIYFSVSCY